MHKAPGFAAVAILTLAIGIGACVAIFSVVNSVLLRPLPFSDPDRLVQVMETKLPEIPEFAVAPGQYFDWLAQSQSFENLAAIRYDQHILTGVGEPERIAGCHVTANTFTTLGVHPALGRDFTPEEDEPGREDVVILNHDFWRRQFGGRADIVNQQIHLDGRSFRVIGVMPKGFLVFDTPFDVFTPAAFTDEEHQRHGAHYIDVLGRLKPGTSLDQVRAEMVVIADRLAKQYPDTNKGFSVKVMPLLEVMVAEVRPMLLLLLGAVGFLLLIACANVANLLLSRATSRSREIAIRAALGASRARIVRQLLTESVVLALLGGGLGWLFALWGTRALIALAPEAVAAEWAASGALPRIHEITVDGRAFGFACALSLVTGVAFGLFPALQANRIDLTETLKEGGRGTSDGGGRLKLRGALVVAEVAVTLVLLAGAGLLIRSFVLLQRVSPGFDPNDALTVSLSLAREKYGSTTAQTAFVEEATSRLAALPGVQAAGASMAAPFVGGGSLLRFKVAGRPETPDDQAAGIYAATRDYIKAMKIPVRSGRTFDGSETETSFPVAVINEAMAKRTFPGENPIGKRISFGRRADIWREIVGVVGDVKHFKVDEKAALQVYVPFAQMGSEYVVFVLRTGGADVGLPSAIRSAIHSIDNQQPIAKIRPFADWIAASMASQRFSTILLTVFSCVAVVLAAIGVYGVTAYSVAQRRGEIGIRIALGAQTPHVVRLVLVRAGRLIAVGVGTGLLCGAVLTHFLASVVFGASSYDPLTLTAVVAFLTFVAVVACLIPSLRAARVDPMTAMRTDQI
jgi:putative ABC transport system permease protein